MRWCDVEGYRQRRARRLSVAGTAGGFRLGYRLAIGYPLGHRLRQLPIAELIADSVSKSRQLRAVPSTDD